MIGHINFARSLRLRKTNMGMGMDMTWAMGAICVLAVIVLLLVAGRRGSHQVPVLPLTRLPYDGPVTDNPSFPSSGRRDI